MKKMPFLFIACLWSLLAPPSQAEHMSYSYDHENNNQDIVSVSKDAFGENFSVSISIQTLSSAGGTPEEIFAELNKLISQKTVVPLEQRYPDIHVKVKDEDLEYDRLYFDQSDDGEKVLIRVKIDGSLDASSSNGELVGLAIPPSMICTWKGSVSKEGKKQIGSFECRGYGPGGIINWDKSSNSISSKLTIAHEKRHAQDYKKFLKKGIKANLKSKAFDSVSGIEKFRDQMNKINSKLTIVMEALAVRAEVYQLISMRGISYEQKANSLKSLLTNNAKISEITSGGSVDKPYEFDASEINFGKIKVNEKDKDININASSSIMKKNGEVVYVVTYGEAYSQLEQQCGSVYELLKKLEEEIEQGSYTKEHLQKIKTLEKNILNKLKEETGMDDLLKNLVEEKSKIMVMVAEKIEIEKVDYDETSDLIETVFIVELNKAYTGSGTPTPEEAVNYFRRANPILKVIKVTEENRAAARKKLEECLKINGGNIGNFFGSFTKTKIGEDALAGSDYRPLHNEFMIGLNKIMKAIYRDEKERSEIAEKIFGIKGMQ